MSEVRVGPLGFEYDDKNHEIHIALFHSPEADEGQMAAMVECVSTEQWEQFSSLLLGMAVATASGKTVEIPLLLASNVLETLRLSTIYTLLGSEFEKDELPEDFKPHKWQGYEKEHAERIWHAYQHLAAVVKGQIE